MGYSATILEKACLVLSLEIDTEIKIEIGTGWNRPPGVSVSTMMEVTVDELDEVIEKLSKMRDQLRQAYVCPKCKYINAPGEDHCENCIEPQEYWEV